MFLQNHENELFFCNINKYIYWFEDYDNKTDLFINSGENYIIYIFFFKTVVKSLNLKIDLDDKRYTVLYDEKKVKFADLDLLKVMFHPNHVRHCSNSIINYMMKLSSGTSPYILFVVKNIDITFEKPLEYNDDYKIFGAITNFQKS
ncbi:hypothetical protein PFFCH_03716 [Plasmodium falciparum FCH/4]|uniref:Uncharacterized protein n=1 Tax=Plasmodium falciparum FCH/4 TaxID=1036724 RepID=A0A024VLV4_PLAFA|nr:hypothetical protein PFFCH_03716 [Plasmodium falciparum FCH/4]